MYHATGFSKDEIIDLCAMVRATDLEPGTNNCSARSRAFTPTPTGYTFGVCPSAGYPSPICAVSPSAVPEVMDTITPPGISQDAELDPVTGPVVLRGLTVP